MIPGVEILKVGDNARLGHPSKYPQAFGIVKSVKIQSTHIEYAIEITHYDRKPMTIGETIHLPHHIVRKNDNDPSTLLKEIL